MCAVLSSKTLVTGGAGFIGSHLVDALMARGYRVRIVDNMSSGRLDNVETWVGDANLELLRGDLKKRSIAIKAVEDVETVFHLAANPDVRSGAAHPSSHLRENLLVTYNLLEAMRKSRQAKRILFASSSTVYGEPEKLPTPEDYGPLLPISVYGACKLASESLISAYCHTYDLQGTILRFANIVGSRSTHGVIFDFFEKLKRNQSELEILGDGTQTKSYLHVKDLIEVFFIVMRTLKRSKCEIFNVGSSDQVKVVRIAEIVSEEMKLAKPRFVFRSPTQDGRGWKGDVKTMCLSSKKLMELGWVQTLTSEGAVRLACRELLSK